MRILIAGDPSASLAPGESLPEALTAAGQTVQVVWRGDPAWRAPLAVLRNELRVELDGVMARFEPQVAHVHGLGLLCHLVLETGVPYIATTDGSEAPGRNAGPDEVRFAEESAQNAARVLAVSDTAFEVWGRRLGSLEGRLMRTRALSIARLLEVYADVLEERFGSAGVP